MITPPTTEIFALLTFLMGLVMLIFAYQLLLKGKFGPMTRAGENEEEWQKVIALERHGLKPNEANRKFSRFSHISWLSDEVKPEDLESDDKDYNPHKKE